VRLLKQLLTQNDCYKAGKKIAVKGLMLHSTGVNNPKLSRYISPDDGLLGTPSASHWNTAKPGGRLVCVHGFIGKLKDGSIATYQTLDWNHRGWGGGGSSNDTHIHVEICEADLNDSAYFNAVYKEAVELFAYLCKQYNLTEKAITTHSEGYKKGIASNHADVMHWFPKHGKSMDTFRADVKKQLAPQPAPKPVEKKEEIDLLEKVIVIGGFPDFAVAEVLAARLKAPVYTRAALPTGKIAKEAYVVGGATTGINADKIIALSGANRFEVAASVKKFLG
jgi:N-acetylmuramoyl-L-alanine amidase